MRPVIRMHACDYDRSAAHGAQWQELELIFGWLLLHGNMRKRRERVVHASLRPAETFMRACRRPTEAACIKWRKQSSADCCQCSKVFTIRIRSALPYHIDMQNAVCATYTYANPDTRTFGTRKRMAYSYMLVKSVLLR